jgi:multicomponent Na+:H+ antiporter subunit G
MTADILDILSVALIGIGSLSLIIGALGVLRLPDVYTRMHAASITDTLGAGSIILGLILQAGLTLVAGKLFLILVFLFFTSPASSFALAHAALSSGVKPILDADLREDDRESSS